MKQEEIEIIQSVLDKIRDYEKECFMQIAFCNKHGFSMESAAIKYKQEAYNTCWLDLADALDRLKDSATNK